jgi:uncharacterized protein involved in exopolysaccharide biosynthesis
VELLDLLKLLRKHARIIALLCLSAAITTFLLMTFLTREAYETKALVLVRPDRNIQLSSTQDNKELLNFPVTGKIETSSNTYIEVIKSRAMAERLVRLLRLDAKLGAKSQPGGEPSTTGTDVASASGRWRSMMAVIIQTLKYGRFIGTLSPFETAVRDVQKNLSVSSVPDTYLFEVIYRADHPQEAADVVNTAADLFLELMNEIDSAQTQRNLQFTEARLRDSERDVTAARRALGNFKDKNSTISLKDEIEREIETTSSWQRDLERIEVRLAGLLKELTPENPKVEVVQAEKDRLLLALADRRHRASALAEKERQLAALALDIRVAEDVYQVIKKEFEQSRLRADKTTSEIKVVARAIPPLFPVDRRRMLYMLGALLMSVVVGSGVALVIEYLHNRPATVESVERTLQLPVLATLPRVRPPAQRT